jgi:hypothetical protein
VTELEKVLWVGGGTAYEWRRSVAGESEDYGEARGERKLNGRVLEAIEQNREKHQVVQFRDLETHKYVAVSADGEVRECESVLGV